MQKTVKDLWQREERKARAGTHFLARHTTTVSEARLQRAAVLTQSCWAMWVVAALHICRLRP